MEREKQGVVIMVRDLGNEEMLKESRVCFIQKEYWGVIHDYFKGEGVPVLHVQFN